MYCLRNVLEKQQGNAVTKRAILLRARNELDDTRKDKTDFFCHSFLIIVASIVYIIIFT